MDLGLISNAVNASNTSMIIADRTVEDDPIIFCNAAFEKLTGYKREEILGKNCRFLQRNDCDERSMHTLRTSLKEGTACTVILKNYRKDGSTFMNELDISAVRSPEGNITHLIGIQREVGALQGRFQPEHMHHDLHSPLTVIKATLEILNVHGINIDPEFLHTSLESAIKAIKRIEDLSRKMFPEERSRN